MFGINNLPTYEEGADWIQTKTAVYLSIGFACLSVIISIAHIIQHLMHYSMPGIQIYVIRILVICPVYAISSSLALALGNNGAYAEIARDVYEAFVIYSFFNLILEYSGGETDCIYQIENEPQLHMPCPLCFLKPRPRDARLMRFCHRGVLQFVIIKPIVAALDTIMIATGNKSKFGYEVFVFIVYNISYGWALYCMFVFYQAIQKLIKKFRPILKFASVKSIVFATYYQSLAVQASSMSPENTVRWNDFILCIEMVFFASLLMIAFPTSEFQGGIPDSKFIENVRSVLSVHDVMQDVYHNFIPVYHDYTLQRSETEAPEVVRMKTYLAGNLDSVAIEMSHRYRGRNKRLAFNSLLRGSTPISARLRNGGINSSNRLFHTRLRTESENSSDISDSEQYYDEESTYGSNSHDGLDDSTDSTMDLCPHSNNQVQNQIQKTNLKYTPQFNGNQLHSSKYLVLNGDSNHKYDEDSGDDDNNDNNDDIESIKLKQKVLLNQNNSNSSNSNNSNNSKGSKIQIRNGFGQKFHHHKTDIKSQNKIRSNKNEIDYDAPLNLQTKTLISPVEQDILERRAISMATHGIGFVVTKKGVEIRSPDYHPTEEEGVLNEGFMSLDDTSHHSKYDRSSANSSPLTQPVNPAAANLPRLPKISSYPKISPEKSSPSSAEKLPRSDNIQIQPLSLPSKPLPSLIPLLPPPSDKNISKSDLNSIDNTESSKSTQSSSSKQNESNNNNNNGSNCYDHDSDASDEEWGWGDFVHHGADFAEFPSNTHENKSSDNNNIQQKDDNDHDICIIEKNPFNENKNNSESIYDEIKLFLNEIISKIDCSDLNVEKNTTPNTPISTHTIETLETLETIDGSNNSQPESPSYLIVSEVSDDKLNLRERESSTESENIVIISVDQEINNNNNDDNEDNNNNNNDKDDEQLANITESNTILISSQSNIQTSISPNYNQNNIIQCEESNSENNVNVVNPQEIIISSKLSNSSSDSENLFDKNENDDVQVIIPIVLEDVNENSKNSNENSNYCSDYHEDSSNSNSDIHDKQQEISLETNQNQYDENSEVVIDVNDQITKQEEEQQEEQEKEDQSK